MVIDHRAPSTVTLSEKIDCDLGCLIYFIKIRVETKPSLQKIINSMEYDTQNEVVNMKIYFYPNILDNNEILNFTALSVKKHSLVQQFTYFSDILESLLEFATDDPNDADYYFVPIFLAAWQFENVDPDEVLQLISGKCIFTNRGRHILVATGDFGQRFQSRYEMQCAKDRAYRDKYNWLDERFILIALESTLDLLPQDIAFFPYMVEFIEGNIDEQSRDILCGFKGKISYPALPDGHIRGKSLKKYKNYLNSEGLSIFDSDDANDLATLSSRELMKRSRFTLCPAGYGQWSFRLIESLCAGSIPVMLADHYVYPFSDNIKWEKYVIRFAEADLAKLPIYLKNIDTTFISELQRNIINEVYLFTKESCLSLIKEKLRKQVNPDSYEWVLPRMRTPSEMGIICIDITNKCDLACSNCTRLLVNQDALWEMSLENFRLACKSLKDFPGVIAVIGGNPCMHSKFKEISEIFCDEIKDRRRRGVWTNNAFKHGQILEERFGHFNLNPHNMERGVKSLLPIHNAVSKQFNSGYYNSPSEHAPLLTAVQDLFDGHDMWKKIAKCDINKNWSAAIVENQGKLRAYFCEVAASFDLARNEDNGMPVFDGWWKEQIESFGNQINKICPGCGAPAKLKGESDLNEVDSFTITNKNLAKKSELKNKRKIVLIDKLSMNIADKEVTKYHNDA
jgi:hypothetical protein